MSASEERAREGSDFAPTGSVPGHTFRERAVAAAGVLAELGVTRLLLFEAGATKELVARITDLPGEMERAVRGELISESHGLRLVFDEHAARWAGAPRPTIRAAAGRPV